MNAFKMKNKLHCTLVCVLLRLAQNIDAQTPDWLWAISAGGTGDNRTESISIDASGNILVAGRFSSPSIAFGATTLNNTGIGASTDIFIVKYDPSGTVLWAKSAGGNNFERAECVSTDASGNILIAGYFQSPSITFGTITLTKEGTGVSNDFFL